jgi:hypothetical protein
MITALLLFHGLLAAALIGAITHQTLGAWWTPRKPVGSLFGRFRAVNTGSYVNTVILLFAIETFVGGVLLYPEYRITARLSLEDYRLLVPLGMFDLKEHFTTVALGLLPAYWYYWKKFPADGSAGVRKFVTTIICFVVWWNFLIGHFTNNIRGLWG